MAVTIDGDGTITGVSVGGLPDGIVDADMIATGAVTAVKRGAGAILQVKQTHLITSDSQSLSAGTYAEINSLSVSITPTTSTSNMLVFIRWSGETSSSAHQLNFGVRRDSTDIGLPAAAGNRPTVFAPTAISFQANSDSTIDSCCYQFLDTGRPSGTNAITYKATARHLSSITLYNQRTATDTDGSEYERSTSTIIVMEVAA